MGNCAASPEKKCRQKQSVLLQCINNKLFPQEFQILQLIFNDLAERVPQKKINLQNFLLFFHKNGQWGDKLFNQFDSDQSNLLNNEQFIRGVVKIFKTEQKLKIRRLFSFFSSAEKNKEGIAFQDLLTMLYNYPKDGLKRILNDSWFIDKQIKKHVKQVRYNRRLESIIIKHEAIDNKDMDFQYQESQTGSQRLQSEYGFKKIIQNLQKPKKNKGTSFKINVQGNSIELKTNNINHLIKKYAKTIFTQNSLSIQSGKLSAQQFELWVLKHKQLYASYYDGFHNQIWQFDSQIKFPKYATSVPQIQSEAKMIYDNKPLKVYLYLIHSTIVVCQSQEHDMPLIVIILDGLAVKKIFDEKGFGIQINHRDQFYVTKKFYFKNEFLRSQWIQLLKYYKGISIQQQYQVGKQIGSGKFSVVYQAKQIQTNALCAIKVISKDKLDQDAKLLIAHQSAIMEALSHPLLVSYKQTMQTKTDLYIITQLVKGKDLFQYVKEHNLTEIQAANIIRQIIIGVKYMHEMGILHRDLKPQNIMILDRIQGTNSEQNIRIIDFGFSNYLSRLQQHKNNSDDMLVGTPGYIAPQVILNQEISYKTDNFSIGSIIYFVFAKTIPFYGTNMQDTFQRTINGDYNYNKDKIWRSISYEAKDLIDKLLTTDQQDRIQLTDALHHPWFKKTNTI